MSEDALLAAAIAQAKTDAQQEMGQKEEEEDSEYLTIGCVVPCDMGRSAKAVASSVTCMWPCL